MDSVLWILYHRGPLCGPGSKGSEGSEGLKGGGGGFAAGFIKRGAAGAAGCVEGLCSLRSGGDSACGAEGCGLPLCGNAYKVSVTGFTFSVIWYDKHSADWLAALASPYPASPDFSTGKRVTRFSGRFASLRIVFPCHPCSGGRINRSMLSCRDIAPWLSIHSPTTKWGKGGGASHQRGMHFQRPHGGCKGFIIRGRLLSIKRRPPRQRARSANQ